MQLTQQQIDNIKQNQNGIVGIQYFVTENEFYHILQTLDFTGFGEPVKSTFRTSIWDNYI